MTGRPLGFVKEPITCPGDGRGPTCSVVTAVPWQGRMYLTQDAAGWAPHGYRCRAHRRPLPDLMPQPADAPPRLPANVPTRRRRAA